MTLATQFPKLSKTLLTHFSEEELESVLAGILEDMGDLPVFDDSSVYGAFLFGETRQGKQFWVDNFPVPHDL